MHIEKLSLIGFKNYPQIELDFSNRINCFVGPNGAGKTNLLDAIHYLSMTKSAFNSVDSQNIRFGEGLFSIKGLFHKNEKTYEVICALRKGQKKIVKVSKKEHEKLSDHIGMFPVVLIAPDDTDLVRGSSETRRKFFDVILSQLDKKYLQHLIRYNHFLKQRNALLKQFNQGLAFDRDLLIPYNTQLLAPGDFLYQRRKEFVTHFLNDFQKNYAWLAEEAEEVDIIYASDCDSSSFQQQFDQALSKDIALERTTLGIHRDDYKFMIQGTPLKKFGSQGQQKTFLLALKLANYQEVKEHLQSEPILLLDDIFDKLDSNRIVRLMQKVAENAFGQIFITDAREERTRSILKELNLVAAFYRVKGGQADSIEEHDQKDTRS
ncbi:MAG: DNA replication/repair protein RecF [Cytophagales bacterium]|nr:DNA replication/repair protein RecF [Cytophagales bacterium]